MAFCDSQGSDHVHFAQKWVSESSFYDVASMNLQDVIHQIIWKIAPRKGTLRPMISKIRINHLLMDNVQS